MELNNLNIDAEVVIPGVILMDGNVRMNNINAGVTKIIINDEEQPIVEGAVSFYIPTKVSDLENDSGFVTQSDVSSMIADVVTDYQKKISVSGETLIVP